VPVVDLDRLEANITRLQIYLDEHKIASRPHVKTHKIPAIAKLQMEAGAVGLTSLQHPR
jgi:D-serine deaminase-like pyridoxal phosphate-dependent protein